jgi:integrase/recombinase XerD
MRVGEAIRLERRDVDVDDGVLAVRQSKFGKSRLVALQPGTVEALNAYAQLRDMALPRAIDPTFFVSRAGIQIRYVTSAGRFERCCRPQGSEREPRTVR